MGERVLNKEEEGRVVVVGDIPDRAQEHKKRGAEDQVREDKQMIGTQLLDASSHFYKRVCLSVGL